MSEWWNKKNTKKWNTISERNMDNMEVDSSEIQYGTIGCSHGKFSYFNLLSYDLKCM